MTGSRARPRIRDTMGCTPMFHRLIAIALLCSLSASSFWSDARANPTATGAAVYQTLRDRGLLEDYLNDAVGEIAGTLVEASGHWPGYRLNGPYASGQVNIYLVDSSRLPEANVLEEYGIDLAPYSIRGNAMAHEETGILFVDTGLLKSLLVAAVLFGESGVDTPMAVGAIRARGIGAFRQIWDPSVNPALESAGYADRWVMLSSGALAFILAHEMGHIYLGGTDVSQRRKPMRFEDKADKDLHWACSDLVDDRYRAHQRIEQDADDFAVEILSKIQFPDGVLTRPLLRYELGARWYIVYSLSDQMVETLYATESQNVLSAMRQLLGAEVYEELIAARPSSGKGSIHVFFPKSHPANIRRASVSLGKLDQSPYSLYHDEPSSTSADIALFEMVLSMECRNLEERRRR